MKHIKFYEELEYNPNNYYKVIDIHQYELLNKDILYLNYIEQEDIINLFKKKFKVKESLDYNEFIDNGVVIGFNCGLEDFSCWINIRTVRISNPTKNWINGRRINEISHEIAISKLNDEWFLVRGVMNGPGSEEVKCDQLGGLLQYFKDRFNI